MQLLIIVTIGSGDRVTHLPYLIFHINRWHSYRVIHDRRVAIDIG